MHADLWFKNAVVYSLNVETFMDADGDGCGDFEGLSRKLDYLKGLGVDALWLAPFQPTPGRDDGYDITDYWKPSSQGWAALALPSRSPQVQPYHDTPSRTSRPS